MTMQTGSLAVAEQLSGRTVTVLRPTSGWAALDLAEVWRFRDLLTSLSNRDIKLRYRQTVLGVVWVILQPLLGAGIFAFVFGKVADLPSDGRPYFLFSYAGLLAWNMFNTTVIRCSNCLVGHADLISKIFFPRLVLPFSIVPTALIDFSVALTMMGVLLVAYRQAPSPLLLLLPLWIVVLLCLALGIGLTAGALTVSFRDVQYILPVALQMLLYGTPIAYSLSKVPQALRLPVLLNPLTSILVAFRASLLGTPMPAVDWLIYSSAVALGLFFFGALAFKRMERQFADVI